MMSAQADQIGGAAHGERSEYRMNRHDGYRPPEWDTRARTCVTSSAAGRLPGMTDAPTRRLVPGR